MADYLVRAIGAGGNVRAFAAVTTALVDEARRRHDTWPTATAALGRALTATALLGAMLKDPNESVTLRVAGDGPLQGIICDADEQGQVRGYVNQPHVDLDRTPQGKLNVGGAVGSGMLHVTRQLALQGIYTGSAELVSGEIGEDLAYYLTRSEQTPSAVGLGVRVDTDGSVVAAGGYLLQLLPATPDADRDRLEENLVKLGSVSLAVERGMTPEEILAAVLEGIEYQVLERRDLHFACRCSRERALGAIALLDDADLSALVEEDHGAELTCHFCNEVYRFTEEEIRAVRKGMETQQ
ncbi:molecular chaperone Hsp33 [Symbiobacterium terraclitae]|uniref:33 kDa chaperonin n=1 Tax=Symbiobacterium terraclitae TaxID=557451 RepID=A0ABS4JW07_9FIRM|nr:Hsp33 family molecular chaperone HslO [Symbiobacterium terraclitae]MBP2019720.1 molecular chaperone Hsp33 [Symbiobacterium terraclitae]